MKRLKQKSNLTQRVIAALVGAPLVVFLVVYHPLSFLFLILGLTALTQYEFYKLIMRQEGSFPLKTYGTFCGLLIVILTYLIETYLILPENYYIVVPFLTIPFFIKLYKKKDKQPFANLGYTYLGIIYVALPFALLVETTFWKGEFLPSLPIGILLILWSFDSGAYFSGKYFGKRKLFERISPKKTWEGFFGGAIIALVVAFFYHKFTDSLILVEWLVIAGIIIVAGTLGDLVESLFKRSIEIKDSGSIIPGHGGFLDRFDGLLLSMPFIVSFIKIFGQLH